MLSGHLTLEDEAISILISIHFILLTAIYIGYNIIPYAKFL